jgi:hypothetical protein
MPYVIEQHFINLWGPNSSPGNVIIEKAPHFFAMLHESVNPTTFTIAGAAIGTTQHCTHIIETFVVM